MVRWMYVFILEVWWTTQTSCIKLLAYHLLLVVGSRTDRAWSGPWKSQRVTSEESEGSTVWANKTTNKLVKNIYKTILESQHIAVDAKKIQKITVSPQISDFIWVIIVNFLKSFSVIISVIFTNIWAGWVNNNRYFFVLFCFLSNSM